MTAFRPALVLLASVLPSLAPAQAGFKEGFFDSQGVRIRYVEQGTGAPVVLIHGFAVTPELNWGLPGIFDGIAATHRVIALDLRGHGKSGKPHDPAAYGDRFVSDVVNLLDHLRLPRAHVVGYSLGAIIALKLVTLHPDRVTSAVLGGGGWEQAGLRRAALFWTPGLERAVREGGSIADIIHIPGTPPHPPEMRDVLDANDPRALLAVLKGGGLDVTERQIRANAVPVLALVGAQDSLVIAGVDRMVGVMPHLEVVKIPAADHLTAVLAPLFGQSIARFLESKGNN